MGNKPMNHMQRYWSRSGAWFRSRAEGEQRKNMENKLYNIIELLSYAEDFCKEENICNAELLDLFEALHELIDKQNGDNK